MECDLVSVGPGDIPQPESGALHPVSRQLQLTLRGHPGVCLLAARAGPGQLAGGAGGVLPAGSYTSDDSKFHKIQEDNCFPFPTPMYGCDAWH